LVLAGVVGVGGHVRQRAVMVAGGGVAHRDGSDGRGTQQAAVAGAGAVEGGRTHHGGREAGRGGRVSVAAVDGRGVELAAGSEEDRVAMEEMLAPSRPAPALPLTGQERLLMRIARNGDPVEKAALDAARREARSAQDVAEYEAYFALQVRPAATDATND
jgi:hypothetical protein